MPRAPSADPESMAMRTEARLWRLIEERTRPDADVNAIDRRIWDLFGEEWAIVYTDLAGFSRKAVEFGIVHFLQVIHEQRRMLLPVVERHDGVLVKCEADSMLLLFRRPAVALRCAVEMLRTCDQINQRRRPEEHVLLCVGLGFGPLLRVSDHEIFGAEVNAASKLGEDIAGAGEILVTDAARAAMLDAGETAFEFSDLAQEAGGSLRNWRARPL
jgi:class 3 adenylate cyclase